MSITLENERDGLLRVIAEAYAHGDCTEGLMEDLTVRAANALTSAELESVAKELPIPSAFSALMPVSASVELSPQSLAATSGVIKRTGTWLSSRVIRLAGTSSVFKLDFSEYGGAYGLSVRLDLDTVSCSVRITLPPTFELKDEIAENQASVVKVRGKAGAVQPVNTLILGGKMLSSSIKVTLK